MKSMWLSSIIPCLNETENFRRLLPYLWQHAGNESVKILVIDEYDIIHWAKKHSHFHIMSGEITVSARKYAHNSYPRGNMANLIVFSMFFLGGSQTFMAKTYQHLLNYR